MISPPTNILDTVVRYDYCCNCGLCAAVCPRRQLRMEENQFGEYHPQPLGRCAESCSLCMQVCPFSNQHGEDEDALGKELFGNDTACKHYASMGWVRDTFVGGVADEAQRLQAPSGGLTTASLRTSKAKTHRRRNRAATPRRTPVASFHYRPKRGANLGIPRFGL